MVLASSLIVPSARATHPAVAANASILRAAAPGPTSVTPFLPNFDIIDHSMPYAWQVEPTMVVNRSGSIFVGWKEARGADTSGIRVGSSFSTDQGQTWAPNVLMDRRPECQNSDPWMALGPDDRVNYAYLEYSCTTGPHDGLTVVNTTNGTWSDMHFLQGNGGLADKDSIWVTASGRIYATWDEGNILWLSWSDDGGSTWASFVDPDDSPGNVLGAIVATNATGTIYLTWWDFGAGFPNGDIYFDWSADGRTWHADQRINSVAGSASGNFPKYPLPAMNVDKNSGAIYITWADMRNGNSDIFTSASTNGGLTWSANKKINDDTGARSPGFPVATVTVATNPSGLPETIDGVTKVSPVMYNWTLGSSHTVNVSQTIGTGAAGSRYNWTSWSDGGAIAHKVIADADLVLTARFVKQHQVSVDTFPAGRTILVDNVSIDARTTFWWDDGVPHWLEAPPQPDDTPEVRYEWRSWSDGMARAHSVAPTAPLSLTATFVREETLRVSTSPEGPRFYVDDIEYSSSQTFWLEPGSSHYVFAPPSQSAPGARYTFVNWSDGGSFGHPIQFSGAMSLEASFRAEFYLTVTTPFGAASGGGWYVVGTIAFASLSRTSVPGATGVRYAFVGWTGDASGAGVVSSGILMDGPKAATADWSTEYQVTVVSDVGTIEGSGWYAAGATGTLHAPAQGTQGGTTYDFAGWTGDATSAQPTLTLT